MEGDVAKANRKCSAVTGSARKLKDNAADWHNLMLRWEKLNDEGVVVAGNIVSAGGGRREEAEGSSRDLVVRNSGLQEECEKLKDIVDKMAAIVAKMERLMASQRGLVDLEEFRFGPRGRSVPLFHSWNAQDFASSCAVLLQSFASELRLKRVLLREAAHGADPDLSLVYLSCWLHQPLVPVRARLALEAVLLETGQRHLPV
ncbi:cyclin-dependent kinase 2-interacting protein isoform X2 [Syngnathoides biaculeatus]|uniref:cyclin-dependent kinase 2-interacting protein isoform X2 n=1 Tax=Syngnathoides biaculeatus TaxID=300417 RepID=UPI002ADE8120|nr:cyclin-dependent kinase 2-interacting protein isoform X2 [Syngnathoides biaculeatus]